MSEANADLSRELGDQMRAIDANVRREASYRLGRIGNDAATPYLLEALADKSNAVRSAALIGMSQSTWGEPKPVLAPENRARLFERAAELLDDLAPVSAKPGHDAPSALVALDPAGARRLLLSRRLLTADRAGYHGNLAYVLAALSSRVVEPPTREEADALLWPLLAALEFDVKVGERFAPRSELAAVVGLIARTGDERTEAVARKLAVDREMKQFIPAAVRHLPGDRAIALLREFASDPLMRVECEQYLQDLGFAPMSEEAFVRQYLSIFLGNETSAVVELKEIARFDPPPDMRGPIPVFRYGGSEQSSGGYVVLRGICIDYPLMIGGPREAFEAALGRNHIGEGDPASLEKLVDQVRSLSGQAGTEAASGTWWRVGLDEVEFLVLEIRRQDSALLISPYGTDEFPLAEEELYDAYAERHLGRLRIAGHYQWTDSEFEHDPTAFAQD